MANISITPIQPGANRIVINGVDYSKEIFRGVELVEVGDDPDWAEVGLRVTFAVSRLDLGDEQDVVVTDNFRSVAQRVHSTQVEKDGGK